MKNELMKAFETALDEMIAEKYGEAPESVQKIIKDRLWSMQLDMLEEME